MSEKFREELPESRESLKPDLREKSLSEINLGDLAEALKKHNTDFNMFRLAGKSMVEAVYKEDDDASSEGFEERTSRERDESFGNLSRTYKTDLSRTGLSLGPVKSPFSMHTSSGEIQGTEMRINIADGKKFLDYLESLDKDNITENQSNGLKSVVEILTKQLMEEYNLENPDDERMMELMTNFSKIVEQYQKFSDPKFSKSVEELSELLKIAKRKYLKEYLVAKREHLLDEPGIGAESPQDYRGKLEKAIETIIVIGKNPKAKEFQQELINIFKKSLQKAKKDFKGWGKKQFEEQEEHAKQPEKYTIFNRHTEDYFEKEEEGWNIVIDEMYDKIENLQP